MEGKRATKVERFKQLERIRFARINPVKIEVENHLKGTGHPKMLNMATYEEPEVGELKGVLFYLPGLGDYGEWHGHFVRDIAQLGLRIFCMDRRGFGNSEGVRGDVGRGTLLSD